MVKNKGNQFFKKWRHFFLCCRKNGTNFGPIDSLFKANHRQTIRRCDCEVLQKLYVHMLKKITEFKFQILRYEVRKARHLSSSLTELVGG